jgi:hypothetical protein
MAPFCPPLAARVRKKAMRASATDASPFVVELVLQASLILHFSNKPQSTPSGYSGHTVVNAGKGPVLNSGLVRSGRQTTNLVPPIR